MRARHLGLALGALLCGCKPTGGAVTPTPPATTDAARPPDAPPVEVRTSSDRPALAVVAREGDARGAVALVALTGGLAESQALLSLVLARVAPLGLVVDGTADRGGFRVTALVANPDEARRATTALADALAKPATGEPDKLFTVRSAAAAKAERADPAEEDVVACGLEPVFLGDEKPLGWSEVEPARRRAFDRTRAALGVVAPDAVVLATADALASSPAWPAQGPPSAEPRKEREPTVHVGVGNTSRVRVAARLPRRAEALALAEDLGRRPGLAAVRAVLHAEGACVVAEAVAPSRDDLVHLGLSLRRALRSAPSTGDAARAGARLRALVDPRELAAASALFAATRDGTTPVSVWAAAALDAKAPESRVASAKEALVTAFRAPDVAALDKVTLVRERGQGEMFALLGSRCPTVEGASEAGLSLVTAAAMARASADGVELSPWVAVDGAGLLGRAVRREGERPEDTASRLGRVLGAAFFSTPPDGAAVGAIRATQLARADQATDAMVESLAGAGASQLVPWGTFEGLGRVTEASAKLKWGTWTRGPVALTALVGSEVEGPALERAVARFSPRGGAPSQCPVAPAIRVAPGSRSIASRTPLERVFVVVPFEPPAPFADVLLELVAEQLDAKVPPGHRATAALYGDRALVVDVRGPTDGLDAAGQAVRAHLTSLANADVRLARKAVARARLERRLDPRARLVDAFRGVVIAEDAGDDAVKAWLTTVLRDDRLAVLRTRAVGL